MTKLATNTDIEPLADAPCSAFRFSREWAMPSSYTLSIPPIAEFVDRWIAPVCVDPFARDCKLACITNDLNPDTEAEHHMDVYDFALWLRAEGISPRSIIFDPPYSARQAADCYQAIGVDPETLKAVRERKGNSGTRTGSGWSIERDALSRIQQVGDVCMSFGWESNGMGKKRGYFIEEILMVAHGAGRHDTICVAERKMWDQPDFFL
jgi:hypothetical protein